MGEFILFGAIAGFWWGEWFGERRAKKLAKADPATLLVASMLSEIKEKRRFVGRSMTITRTEHIEILGEEYSLSLASKGDASLIDEAA